MNRFEQAVHDCMKPTAKLLEATTKPLHRAILLNFWRHVHLEGAGEYDRILAPDMIVDHPVYRVTWGANPAVIEGKDGVRAFYNSVGEAVLWHSDDRLAVADWGVCDEITFHQLAMGSDLRLIGYDVERADRLYHVYSRQAFIWPYDDRARLAGEHLYEDKTSLRIEEVDRSEAITPARVREIHRQQLAKLEAERGPNFWVLGGPDQDLPSGEQHAESLQMDACSTSRSAGSCPGIEGGAGDAAAVSACRSRSERLHTETRRGAGARAGRGRSARSRPRRCAQSPRHLRDRRPVSHRLAHQSRTIVGRRR